MPRTRVGRNSRGWLGAQPLPYPFSMRSYNQDQRSREAFLPQTVVMRFAEGPSSPPSRARAGRFGIRGGEQRRRTARATCATASPSIATAQGIDHAAEGIFFPGVFVGIFSHPAFADRLGAAATAAVSQSGPTRTTSINASSRRCDRSDSE